MPRALSGSEIEQYHSQGWLSPLDVLSPTEVAEARAALERFETEHGPFGTRPERSRAYLRSPGSTRSCVVPAWST